MYLGLYQGSAAMTGLEKWQTQISQNLANSGVAGYKAATVAMSAGRGEPGAPAFGQALQKAMLDAEFHPDLSQGEFVPSDNPLDTAIDGPGFYEIEQEDGSTLYTRDGQFHISAENVLVNKNDRPVMGTGGQVQIAPGNGEPHIDGQGRVFQGATQIGELSIIDIGNTDALQATSGGFVVAEDQDAEAQPVENPRVLQYFYESSNVSPVREMVNLIAVTRAFEANQKVVQTADHMMEKATAAFAPQ